MINYSDDILDSRDLAERLSELQDEKQDLEAAVDEALEAVDSAMSERDEAVAEHTACVNEDEVDAAVEKGLREAIDRAEGNLSEAEEALEEAEEALSEWLDENIKELSELENAENEIPEWNDGNNLIADSYFEAYMDDFLEGIGDIPKNVPSYIKIEIDYDMLKQDYSEIELDGNTFWYRSC